MHTEPYIIILGTLVKLKISINEQLSIWIIYEKMISVLIGVIFF